MKNKLLMLLAALAISTISLAAPASATNDNPDHDNKPVTFCHYAGSNENGGSGNYVKLTLPVQAFYQAGHIGHTNDIWEAFSYVTNGGQTVNVPAQGDTALLAFEDCEAPEVDEPVTKPDVTFNDPCGTANDTFAVSPGRGYTVGITQTDGVIQSITVTLNEGFTWADLTTAPLRFERPVFTNVDCDVPNTGAAEYATGAGAAALAGLVALGGVMFMRRRQTV